MPAEVTSDTKAGFFFIKTLSNNEFSPLGDLWGSVCEAARAHFRFQILHYYPAVAYVGVQT